MSRFLILAMIAFFAGASLFAEEVHSTFVYEGNQLIVTVCDDQLEGKCKNPFQQRYSLSRLAITSVDGDGNQKAISAEEFVLEARNHMGQDKILIVGDGEGQTEITVVKSRRSGSPGIHIYYLRLGP